MCLNVVSGYGYYLNTLYSRKNRPPFSKLETIFVLSEKEIMENYEKGVSVAGLSAMACRRGGGDHENPAVTEGKKKATLLFLNMLAVRNTDTDWKPEVVKDLQSSKQIDNRYSSVEATSMGGMYRSTA